MQTKQQIQQLLASAGIEPNKRLGQHFLIDLNLMRLLIDSAAPNKSDIVLEVGCGTGSFTEGLAERAGAVITVEYDRTLAQIAQSRLAESGNVTVICSDILQSKNTIDETIIKALKKQRQRFTGQMLLVANLPYNVASAVMLNLIAGPVKADAMYVTVQKEVAQRMAAEPGGKDYGVLSIFMAAAGEVKMIRVLKPSVFWPAPQVDSAMVSFVRDQEKIDRIHSTGLLKEVVNLFMGHRRKMLKACAKLAVGQLSGIHNWAAVFEECAIDPHNRAEKLSPADYVAVANLCAEYLRIK